MVIHDFLCLHEWTRSEKQKASTYGATSSHVTKRTRFAMAQSFGSTTCPTLIMDNSDDGSSDDDDACVGILLVNPIRSTVMITSSGNQGGSSAAPTAEEPVTRDMYSRGKGIMVDDVVVPSIGVSRPRPSSRPAPSFRDVSRDSIHTDFFPFSVGPYYATYPEGGVARNREFTRRSGMLRTVLLLRDLLVKKSWCSSLRFASLTDDIQCAGSDHDHYQEAACAHHEDHMMHDSVQLDHIVDSHTDYTSDSNITLYDQYVKDNEVLVVHSDVSSVPTDAFMMIYDDMCKPHDQSVSYPS
nr:hypothetical protein [Tanacetum cinerariifolium]